MDSTTSLPSLHVDVSCGAVLCYSKEGKEFLQKRQALLGRVSLVLCFGLYFFLNLLLTLAARHPWSAWVTSPKNQLHLVICLVFLASALVCRARPLSRLTLAAVDTSGAVLVGILIGVMSTLKGSLEVAQFHSIMAITVTLFVRSVTIPSSARQTLVTSSMAIVPVIVGYAIATTGELDDAGPGSVLLTMIFSAWCVTVVVTVTVASRVIFGLREQVHEAKQLGQYTLQERIGSGGMGDVYRASHVLLRRPTAVKILRPDDVEHGSVVRFEREVQLTSQLTHPNTIAIYDFGRTPDGLFYYAMEYLEGVNLQVLVREDGRQPPSRVIHILLQICDSLIEAHETGLIHRDIKPANIFLCERGGVRDVVKVLDFGLVKNLENPGDVSISVVNTIKGSPLYMAPESIRTPEEIDARSDLYSVGAVGYYLLTGKPLFEAENFLEICSHHLQTIPEPPSTRIGESLPGELEKLILDCLAKDVDGRPVSARALRDALRGCRDAGRWTEKHAGTWWDEHAHLIKEPERESRDDSSAVVSAGAVSSSDATRTVATSVDQVVPALGRETFRE